MSAQPLYFPSPAAADAAPPAPVIGQVEAVYADHCLVRTADGVQRALAASHLPLLLAGQRVLAQPDPDAGELLIYAAFPAPRANATAGTEPAGPAVSYDAATRTLSLEAGRLQINALDAIELRCGGARLRLTLQGEVQVLGETITSSATGTHRIEGASIDLN